MQHASTVGINYIPNSSTRQQYPTTVPNSGTRQQYPTAVPDNGTQQTVPDPSVTADSILGVPLETQQCMPWSQTSHFSLSLTVIVTVEGGEGLYLPYRSSFESCKRDGDSRKTSVSDSFSRALKFDKARRLGSITGVISSGEPSKAMI